MRTIEYTRPQYLQAAGERILIYDGAMGTSIQALNLGAADFGGEATNGCNDYLVITLPQAIAAIHRSFLEAGADVIETNTFRSNRLTLTEYGLAERTLEINRTAALLARTVADEFSTPAAPRFVAGSIGPSGMLPSANDPELSVISFDELAAVFAEQAEGLILGGVDLLLIETAQDLLEIKAAVAGVQQAFERSGERLPLQVQFTLDTSGRMLLGTEADAALTALEALPVDVIGLNCSTGPEHMREPLRLLSEATRLPIACLPNAGLPLNVDGEAVYPMLPKPFADELISFVRQHGINIVGGCCGTTPEHIRRMATALRGMPRPRRDPELEPRLASAMRSQQMCQDPPPLLIGERLNTQGSRLAKRLIIEGDLQALVALGREQVEGGAHALDICVALTEEGGEAETMARVVHALASAVDAPLVIDSTEPDVMQAGLKAAPGRSVLNSVNLEGGREKFDTVLRLARQHGAAVIALTIDEQGMAETAERKLAIARRITQLAVEEHGLQAADLIFDPLTFTLATGEAAYQNSAQETIEGLRRITRELPGVFTSLGVSNVSFGLSAPTRRVLNSIMLFHCVQAGLDMAIVNPAQILPLAEIPEEERLLAEDLLFNRRQDALARLIEHFSGRQEQPAAEADPSAGLEPADRIHWRILQRHGAGIEQDIDALLGGYADQAQGAVAIINQVLLPAMQEVGDRFGAGELILPFVLQSAEVMKKAVSHVEGFLDRLDEVSKGTVVLATVYGDVHDIGKNLVKTILSNNGYQVEDLGKQVPVNVIVDRAAALGADAIGLSALLVSTSKQMPLVVAELRRRGLQIPVLIGGAAINRRFGRRMLFDEHNTPYPAGVFYCKDAFEGLAVLNQLQQGEQREVLLQETLQAAQLEVDRPPIRARKSVQRRSVQPAETIPVPPVWGPRVVEEMPLEMVFEDLSLRELFRLSWGAKNSRGEEWRKLRAEFETRLASMKRAALANGWLAPQGAYGYWPAQARGDDLLIYAPRGDARPREVLHQMRFPRQPGGKNLCLADYFAPHDSGRMDLVAFQIVTIGAGASDYVNELEARGAYSEAYYAHGLAVQVAEAAAEFLHRHIRRELGLGAAQGKRYSWGYPAIPDLEDHRVVFDLLPAGPRLGMALSSACQLIPEQSTAAIVLHHPQAVYYSVGKSRVEQLSEAIESLESER